LNRPERLNAISGAMLAQLSDELVDRDPQVRAVVLTGAGRGFCAGLDLQDAASGSGIGGDGVLPESGGTWLLPRLVGWARAAEIIFTGRTLSARDCLALGLVNRVVPGDRLREEALALAGEIAANAPLAVQASKRMMRMGLSEEFSDHVHHVYLQLLPLFRTKDFREGLLSFLETRAPDFEGP
jgi:enoyl-CoA hydratase/carnithine racemase